MSTKRANGLSGGGRNYPASTATANSMDSYSHRKQSIINTAAKDSGFSLELKGEKVPVEPNFTCEMNVSISSLKTRLAPTIRTTLSTAVDTLLGEIVLVLAETQRELMSKEQENEKLKVRLEVSERELKTLQECLCSAQKLIDQLQGPFGGPSSLGQQGFQSSPQQSMSPSRHSKSNGSDTRCFPGGEPELSGALGEALHGFDARDEYKSCHLSIQADGTVTNQQFHTLPVNEANFPASINRSGGEAGRGRLESTDPISNSQPRFGVKQEQGSGLGLLCPPGARGPTESELSAQSVGDLGYIHVVEEGAGSRSQHHPKAGPAQHRLPGPHGGAASACPTPPGGSGVSSARQTGPGLGPDGADFSSDEPRRLASVEVTGDPTGERPHLCLECGKSFRLISSLKKHVRIHTGEKPYPCSVCGRRFRESGALKTHLRIHTGEKPYACSECGTRFRHLDGLRKHGRTHTGEKPYACGVCGKRLSRLQHLKHHQRIHTGERPCCCPYCHRTFKEQASLRKHLRTHQGRPGADDAQEGVPLAGLGEAEGDPHLQGSMMEGDMRFGMWGEEEAEEDEEGEAVVDCV